MSLKYNRFIIVLLIFLLNCTITIKPRINVNVIDATDNLERQILGEFKVVEKKMLYYEKNPVSRSKKITDEEKKFYSAMKNRIFFQDKITNFLKNKYIGEGQNGKLKILFNDKSSLIYSEILNIVRIENGSRETIINFIAQKQNIKNKEEFWKTFHTLQVENLQTGMLYEEGGKWIEKK